jgi:hypothetical protein
MPQAYEILNYRRLPHKIIATHLNWFPRSLRMHLIFQLDLLQFGWINAYSQVLD